jgi:hypothetical protein
MPEMNTISIISVSCGKGNIAKQQQPKKHKQQ